MRRYSLSVVLTVSKWLSLLLQELYHSSTAPQFWVRCGPRRLPRDRPNWLGRKTSDSSQRCLTCTPLARRAKSSD